MARRKKEVRKKEGEDEKEGKEEQKKRGEGRYKSAMGNQEKSELERDKV